MRALGGISPVAGMSTLGPCHLTSCVVTFSLRKFKYIPVFLSKSVLSPGCLSIEVSHQSY